MSYCRFAWGGSDVYVYEGKEGITCCGCKLKGFTTTEPEEMIGHLALHRRAGHFVPGHAILALWEDVPGAQRPSKPEPNDLTKVSIQMQIELLRAELERLSKKE